MQAAESHPPVPRDARLGEFAGKRVLVTGGAGFVGSSVSRALVDLGADVLVLDDFSTGRRELLPNGIAELIDGTVEDATTVRQAVQGCDYIFHMAVRNIILSTTQLMEDYSVNIGGTLNVLIAAKEMTSRPRVLYTSSTSIYGNPRSLPITEDEGVSILSPYAASKLAGESYCSAFFEMYQLPVSSVRYSNVYGINQSPRNPYCGVISKLLAACIEGHPMQIHGTGLQTRDFTYVEDAVEATLLAAVHPRAEGEIFNVGSGRETTILALARMIAEACGVTPRVELVDRRDIDNVQRRVVNIEKARRVLRWIPQVSLEDGLRRTHDWLLGTVGDN